MVGGKKNLHTQDTYLLASEIIFSNIHVLAAKGHHQDSITKIPEKEGEKHIRMQIFKLNYIVFLRIVKE
jgi:hypothetical protein